MKGKMLGIVTKTAGPGLFIEELPIPQIKDNEVLVKVRACGICGSDTHMYEGSDSYKVFEKFYPIVIGHEFSGEVVEVGKTAKGVAIGDRVVVKPAAFCLTCDNCRKGRFHFCSVAFQRILGLQKNGGFAEYAAVEDEACIVLPDSIDFDLAALIEPLGVTANAVYDSNLEMGETVVIQGPGPIGLLTLLFAKARGAGKTIIIGTTKDRARLEIAKKFDVDHILIVDEEDPVKGVKDLTNGRGADIVFEASGIPSLVQTALDMSDTTGRVVIVGIYDKPGEIALTPMVRAAKKLIGTYGGPIAWERLIQWLGAKSHYASLAKNVISHRTKIEDAMDAFERSVKKENIKELIVFDD